MIRRHVWQKQIVPMLNWIRYECGPQLQRSEPWYDSDHRARAFAYDELANRSDGLDFTTDGPASVRHMLYHRRQDVQAQFGLYFDDYPGGLRFTMVPKLGMLWRYEEEQRRTQSALARTADMTQEAIKASGTTVEAALFRAVAKQYGEVEAGAGRLREMTQQLLKRPEGPEPPKALPAGSRRRRRRIA